MNAEVKGLDLASPASAPAHPSLLGNLSNKHIIYRIKPNGL